MPPKKAKPTPKLDATVKAVRHQSRMPVPEYARPYHELQRRAGVGMVIKVKKRSLNSAEGRYDLIDIEGTISDLNSNFVEINTGAGFRSTPWWAIHDWEIVGEVEI